MRAGRYKWRTRRGSLRVDGETIVLNVLALTMTCALCLSIVSWL